MKNWWIVVVVATAGDAGVEGAVADRRDQLGMDSQSFVAISGCNLALAGARHFVTDG